MELLFKPAGSEVNETNSLSISISRVSRLLFGDTRTAECDCAEGPIVWSRRTDGNIDRRYPGLVQQTPRLRGRNRWNVQAGPW